MAAERWAGENGFLFRHAVTARPGRDVVPLHVHDGYELYCFLSGRASYLVEGTVYPLRPGCLVLMRQAEVHRLLPEGEETYERFTLNFRPDAIDVPDELWAPFRDRELGCRNFYPPDVFPHLSPRSFFDKVSEERARIGTANAVRVNLPAFLAELYSVWLAGEQEERGVRENVDEWIEWINANLCAEISLDGLSRRFHVSASQISRVFRRRTGTSVYQYVLSKRLILAQERIARGENAVRACEICGFSDYSSFYRQYRKRYGCAPTKNAPPIPVVD